MEIGPINYGANGLQTDDYTRRWVYRRRARGLSWDEAHKGERMGEVGLYSHAESARHNTKKFADRVGFPWPPEQGY